MEFVYHEIVIKYHNFQKIFYSYESNEAKLSGKTIFLVMTHMVPSLHPLYDPWVIPIVELNVFFPFQGFQFFDLF